VEPSSLGRMNPGHQPATSADGAKKSWLGWVKRKEETFCNFKPRGIGGEGVGELQSTLKRRSGKVRGKAKRACRIT